MFSVLSSVRSSRLPSPVTRATWLLGVVIYAAALPATADVVSDPTRPANVINAQRSAVATTNQPLILQSIIVGHQRRLALINGRRVAEGELIEDIQLIAIHSRSVSLQRNGEVFQLQLTGAGVSRVPRQ